LEVKILKESKCETNGWGFEGSRENLRTQEVVDLVWKAVGNTDTEGGLGPMNSV